MQQGMVATPAGSNGLWVAYISLLPYLGQIGVWRIKDEGFSG
jgi:hypothetical protein